MLTGTWLKGLYSKCAVYYSTFLLEFTTFCKVSQQQQQQQQQEEEEEQQQQQQLLNL